MQYTYSIQQDAALLDSTVTETSQCTALQDQKVFASTVEALRIIISEDPTLRKYNDRLNAIATVIQANLDAQLYLYNERDQLQKELVLFEGGRKRDSALAALEIKATHETGVTSEKAVTRLLGANKIKTKTMLMPRRNEKAWDTLQELAVKHTNKTSDMRYINENNNKTNGTRQEDRFPFIKELPSQDKSGGSKIVQSDQLRMRVAALRNRSREQRQHTKWLPIPRRFKAFPSVVQQLRRPHKIKNFPQSRNYFGPLYLGEVVSDQLNMEEMIGIQAREARADIEFEAQMGGEAFSQVGDEATQPIGLRQGMGAYPTISPSALVTAGIEDLEVLLGMAQLPPEIAEISPPSYQSVMKSSPVGIRKVKVELLVRGFAKNYPKNERMVKIWTTAKRFDKQVVLCPVVNEPLPVLRTDNEIRYCLTFQYFQDRYSSRRQHPSTLAGYMTFGVTIDEDDFLLAMKDWATSNNYDLNRTDRTEMTVSAGFLTIMPLTSCKEDVEAGFRSVPEYANEGRPDIHVRISTVYGKQSNASSEKAPAWCVECKREELESVVRLCQTIFTGNNPRLPSFMRKAFYLPTRSLPIDHQARQTYIAGQLAYLQSELTVTCDGLQDISSMVRLQSDPTVQTSVEDLLLSITAVNGKLLRSVVRVSREDTKVFLIFDESNLRAWAFRQKTLADVLKHLVYEEDHGRVFRNQQGVLGFSNAWRKFKNEKISKNLVDIPNAQSVAYIECMMQKLPDFGNIQPYLKKRGHGSVAKPKAPAEIDLTEDGATPVSSPSHKVQVVEQRAQTTPLPATVALGSSTVSSTTQAESNRIDALEAVVTDHGVQLHEIKTSVVTLNGKINSNHEETRSAFSDFHSLLSEIKNVVKTRKGSGGDGDSAWEDTGGCYNPTGAKSILEENLRRYHADVHDARVHRAELEQQLFVENAGGAAVDYARVAYERFPSPAVPEDCLDDMTLYY